MDIFEQMARRLSEGESFALVTILARSGSTPRCAGTRMIVRFDGSIIGSIGGGILEAEAVRTAREIIRSGGAVSRGFYLTPEDVDGVGMTCGGHLELLVHFVDASDQGRSLFYRNLLDALGKNERVWLITRVPRDGESHPDQCLASKGGWIASDSRRKAPDLPALIDRIEGGRKSMLVEEGGERYLIERLESSGTVYIFGAGHLAQSVAPLAGKVGFRVIVLDDRKEFANADRFETADEIIVPDSFEHSLRGLDINRDSYIIIVTRGHSFDGIVLEAALRTDAVYIGMIGSRKKRNAIYDALRARGFTERDLSRVHSPIGLDIGAESPEEIAVSIVAELIKVRAENAHAFDRPISGADSCRRQFFADGDP